MCYSKEPDAYTAVNIKTIARRSENVTGISMLDKIEFSLLEFVNESGAKCDYLTAS